MSLRISIREDLIIEVMATSLIGKRPKHLKCNSVEKALLFAEFFMKRDLEAARGNQFTPRLVKDARKAFAELESKSPYSQTRK